MDWFQLINSVNRLILANPFAKGFQHSQVDTRRQRQPLEDSSWKTALSALGAEYAHRIAGAPEDLIALEGFFARHIDKQGNWLTPIDRVEYIMKGYSLLYLCQTTPEAAYRRAADLLVESLLGSHPHICDGSLPYVPMRKEILVDTLAMICPFLARYARQYQHPDALKVSVTQLVQFIGSNVDAETHLPYHGYYAGGPKRLGMHAWGRGTGWYMLGLIDTLLEMPQGHSDYENLLAAYAVAASSMKEHQRPDGHWPWAILHKEDNFDSSTTSLVGYSITRGIQAGLLDESFRTVTDAAIQALVGVTRSNGMIEGSLGECMGLGKYPQWYGPTLWLQGSTVAFAALYIANWKNDRPRDSHD